MPRWAAEILISLAVALLAADGRLSWDDDIRRYVPEVPDFGDQVTLRHLAARMDVDYRYLRSVIANRAGDRYRDFSISKRGGGVSK